MPNRSGRGRIKRTNTDAGRRHQAVLDELWRQEQERQRQRLIDDMQLARAYIEARPQPASPDEQETTTWPT